MRRFPLVICAALVLALAWTLPAGAAPCAACSTLPDCIGVCPAGDMGLQFIVVDGGFYPTQGVTLVLEFSGCSVFAPCLVSATSGYTVDTSTRRVSGTTDQNGEIFLSLAMGGTCAANGVIIVADGVELGRRGMASPDQDGNLVVDDADVAIAQAKLGLADPTADFDCNGVVTQSDVNVVRAHLGHHCDLTTPAARRTWGRLKILYR